MKRVKRRVQQEANRRGGDVDDLERPPDQRIAERDLHPLRADETLPHFGRHAVERTRRVSLAIERSGRPGCRRSIVPILEIATHAALPCFLFGRTTYHSSGACT